MAESKPGEVFAHCVTEDFLNLQDQFTGSDVPESINCDPCGFENTKTEAKGFCYECNEFLCDDCLQSHRKFRSFRDHNILTGTSMPRNKQTEEKKLAFKLCDDHRMNEVQFYCCDHKSVFCGLCKRGKHSSCKTRTITESTDVRDRSALSEAISNIESIKAQFEKLKQKDSDKIDEVKQISRNCKDRLKIIKKQMEDIFEELDKEVNNENNESLAAELIENIKIYGDAIKHITALNDHMKQVEISTDAVAIFAAQAKLRKLYAEYLIVKETFHFKAEKKISETSSTKITEIQRMFEEMQKKVIPEKAKEASQANLAQHKEEKNKASNVANSNSGNFKNLNSATREECGEQEFEIQSSVKAAAINMQKKNYTKTHSFENLQVLSKFLATVNQSETVPCDITGLQFLPKNFLVLCNNANSELILLDINFEVTHKLQFSLAPWDITLINEAKMAVTFPEGKQYKYVTIESGKLKEGSSIKLKRTCWGIAAYKDKLVLSYHDNPGKATIEVRVTGGQKVLEISMNKLVGETIIAPFYVDVNKTNGNIYVTDSEKQGLACFSIEGQLLWKYENNGIKHSSGLIVDDEGNCIVCVESIMKLMMVKEKTKELEELWLKSDIFGVWQTQRRIPQSVAINWENGTIVVGHKDKKQIQVIKWYSTKAWGNSTTSKK